LSSDVSAISSGSLARIAPGLAMLRDYRREWLKAAVALPVAIAYAQLAGFPPVVGLYAAMLPSPCSSAS
jgi:MFS superfamily sulfate permease-like transporter